MHAYVCSILTQQINVNHLSHCSKLLYTWHSLVLQSFLFRCVSIDGVVRGRRKMWKKIEINIDVSLHWHLNAWMEMYGCSRVGKGLRCEFELKCFLTCRSACRRISHFPHQSHGAMIFCAQKEISQGLSTKARGEDFRWIIRSPSGEKLL